MTKASKEIAEQFHARACELAGGLDPTDDQTSDEFYDACRKVVREARLEFIRDTFQTETYRDPASGLLVNLWITGDALGFDGQTE